MNLKKIYQATAFTASMSTTCTHGFMPSGRNDPSKLPGRRMAIPKRSGVGSAWIFANRGSIIPTLCATPKKSQYAIEKAFFFTSFRDEEFREPEFVMERGQRPLHGAFFHDQRDVVLARPRRDGHDVHVLVPKGSEDAAGDARNALHVFAYRGNDRHIRIRVHVLDGLLGNFGREGFPKRRQSPLFVRSCNDEADVVLRRRLGHEKNVRARRRSRREAARQHIRKADDS